MHACGRVEDVEFSLPEPELAALARRHHVEIDTVVTTFNGLCRHCRAGGSAGSA